MKVKSKNVNKKLLMSLSAIVIGIIIGYFIGIYTNQKNNKLSISQEELSSFINDNLIAGDEKASIEKISSLGAVSKVDLKFKGMEDSLFITNDGNILLQKIVDISEVKKTKEEEEKGIVIENKTKKPEVELFVMSYCPYGTQMEKGYLPVIDLLDNKIDAKIKFVNYAMHGEKEVKENVLQYCIQKDKPEQFNDYLTCFLDKEDSSVCLKETNINSNELQSCINDTMNEFQIEKDLDDKDNYLSGRFPRFGIHDDLNKKYGVQGSPTLIVNGQKIDRAGRSPQEILDIVCSAFENKPKECDTKLSSYTYQPGFGYKPGDTSVKTDTASADCGA